MNYSSLFIDTVVAGGAAKMEFHYYAVVHARRYDWTNSNIRESESIIIPSNANIVYSVCIMVLKQ